MTRKGHGVIIGHSELLNDPKGHGELCGWFDIVYNPKRLRGHLEVAVTYFIAPKVNLTLDLDLDLAGDHKCPGNTILLLGSHGFPYIPSMQFYRVF